MHPKTIAPGEIAFGGVYFGDPLPKGTTFEVTATGEEVDDLWTNRVDLPITEHNIKGGKVIVLMTNPTEEQVEGPMGIGLVCFNSDGVPTDIRSGYADQDNLPAGGTASGDIDFYSDGVCKRFIIGASGYTF